MTSSASAVRYARALAEVAAETGDTQAALAQIGQFAGIFVDSKELRDAVGDPVLPLAVKMKIIERIAERAGLLKIVRNFLFVLLERNRLGQTGAIVEALHRIVDEEAGIMQVEVVSASPLPDDLKRRLELKVAEMADAQVRMSYAVDEALIGGVKLQLGSTVIDGTVQALLNRLERQLSV